MIAESMPPRYVIHMLRARRHVDGELIVVHRLRQGLAQVQRSQQRQHAPWRHHITDGFISLSHTTSALDTTRYTLAADSTLHQANTYIETDRTVCHPTSAPSTWKQKHPR